MTATDKKKLIIEVAQQILDDKIGVIQGSREIKLLGFQLKIITVILQKKLVES